MITLPQHVQASLRALALPPGRTVTLGLSGGRDSIALLHVLQRLQHELQFSLNAVHVHHGLSPHADQWQAFCEQQCAQLGVPLQVVRLQLQRRAGQSLEAVAREARYEALWQTGATVLVLAQHQDDQAETFLLQALRGAGVAGLASMAAERRTDGRLVLRPLLHVRRDAINQWLHDHQLHWVDDESNADPRYRRNALRLQVMPVLQAIQPGAVDGLARAAAHCAEADALLHELACMDGDPTALRLPVVPLLALAPARARNLLRSWLRCRGVRAPTRMALHEFLDQIREAAADRQPRLDLDGGAVRRFGGELWWVPAWEAEATVWHWTGAYSVQWPGWQGTLTLQPQPGGLDMQRLAHTPLVTRGRGGGERLQLAAARPSRRLKNLFQEHGIPPWERERWPLLFAGDELVAIPNVGVAPAWQSEQGLFPLWQPA